MVTEMEFPSGSQIDGKERAAFYRDAFKVKVKKDNLVAKEVYFGVFAYLPKPVQWALKARNAVVKPLGFSASNSEMSLALADIETGKHAGFLTIENVCPQEVICAAYEPNMDMWLSVLKLSDKEFAVSTLVNLKTKKGEVYMALIKPFHKLVAKFCIHQALKAGRL